MWRSSRERVRVANDYGNSIRLFSVSGSTSEGATFAGGRIEHPQGVAIDGAGARRRDHRAGELECEHSGHASLWIGEAE
jgi:hypothetical protein